jgi:hypothetical protein
MNWTLTLVTTNNYDSLTELHTRKMIITTAHIVFSTFTSRRLVAASNGGRSPSPLFPTATLKWLNFEVKVLLRPTVVTHLSPKTRFLLFSDSCVFVDVGCPLWWEERFLVYNCCWTSPAQSLSSPSTVGFITIFYCLRFPPPGGPCPRIYIPQEQRGQVVLSDSGFPFHRLLRLTGQSWKYSNPPPHGYESTKLKSKLWYDRLSVD